MRGLRDNALVLNLLYLANLDVTVYLYAGTVMMQQRVDGEVIVFKFIVTCDLSTCNGATGDAAV